MNTVALDNISFPVYRLGVNKPQTLDKVTFFLMGKDTEYSDAEYKLLIVDDKSVAGDTLAKRRLRLMSRNVGLYSLTKAIFFLGDLIKLAKRKVWFIDAEGLVFNLSKTKMVPLVFKRISKVIHIPTGGAIIEVEGLAARFKTLFAPTIEQKYAALLVDGKSHILYGLYEHKYSDTRRSI